MYMFRDEHRALAWPPVANLEWSSTVMSNLEDLVLQQLVDGVLGVLLSRHVAPFDIVSA